MKLRRIYTLHGQFRFVDPAWQKAVEGSEIWFLPGWGGIVPQDAISNNPGNTSQVFRIATSRGNLVFKRYTPAKWRFFLRASKASNEWRGLKSFAGIGIAVPELVAFGEDRKYGRLVAGYIVTSEIPEASDLEKYSVQDWFPRSSEDKEKIFVELRAQLFQLIKKSHAHNLFHQDLNWRNILVNKEQGKLKLWWIDCPRFTSGVFNRKHSILVDLSCISRVALSMMTRSQRFRSLLIFFDGNKEQTEKWFREIESHHRRSKNKPRLFDPAKRTFDN